MDKEEYSAMIFYVIE